MLEESYVILYINVGVESLIYYMRGVVDLLMQQVKLSAVSHNVTMSQV